MWRSFRNENVYAIQKAIRPQMIAKTKTTTQQQQQHLQGLEPITYNQTSTIFPSLINKKIANFYSFHPSPVF